jgi:hypothetical protein
MTSRLATLKQRFDAFDGRLDAWAERHWPVLSVLGTTLSVVLLFGGVALHAVQSGFAHAAALRCGPLCLTAPGFESMAAVLCGGAAIVFVRLYAALTSTVQRRVFEPFKYVRPEPPTRQVARWAAVLHCLIGIGLLLAMAGLAKEQIPGRFKANLGGLGTFEMFPGWWVGGPAVLRFFWPNLRQRRTLHARSRR